MQLDAIEVGRQVPGGIARSADFERFLPRDCMQLDAIGVASPVPSGAFRSRDFERFLARDCIDAGSNWDRPPATYSGLAEAHWAADVLGTGRRPAPILLIDRHARRIPIKESPADESDSRFGKIVTVFRRFFHKPARTKRGCRANHRYGDGHALGQLALRDSSPISSGSLVPGVAVRSGDFERFLAAIESMQLDAIPIALPMAGRAQERCPGPAPY